MADSIRSGTDTNFTKLAYKHKKTSTLLTVVPAMAFGQPNILTQSVHISDTIGAEHIRQALSGQQNPRRAACLIRDGITGQHTRDLVNTRVLGQGNNC